MKNGDTDRWFVDEVLPLEGALTRFLARKMQRGDELVDLRQEVYARLYEAARGGAKPLNLQAFVLTVARNMLIDRARRQRVVGIEYVADIEAVVIDDFMPAPDREVHARLELGRVHAAIETLPVRCREALVMRRIEDIPQKQVAKKMGIAENTVEQHLRKGVRLLADRLFGTAASVSADRKALDDDAA